MRSYLLIAALSAITSASPVPQEINLDLVVAAPDPTYSEAVGVTAQVVTYNTAAVVAAATSVTSVTVQSVAAAETDAAARLAKRGNCASQPAGATGAPTVSTDTPQAFATNAAFASAASGAAVPTGYDQTFTNLNASNNAYGYMGFTTLQTYDTQACASKCDKMNGCMAVNVYFERDPSLDPGTSCPNPSSVTMIKCVFWGGPVSSSNANNYGQYRQNFQVVIAGSNGYVNKTLATPIGYNPAVYLGNAAINAPYDSQGYNTYMGSKIFTAGPFNASLCADYCSSQNTYNTAHPPTDGSPVQTCQFFNTYILYINTTSNTQGQYCAIYSEAWDSSYATNTGQYRGSDHYMIEYSYTFTNSSSAGGPNKNGAIHQASKDITYSTLQSYCSNILGYSTPLATVTATATITPVTTVSTSILVSIATVTSTAPANGKRQDSSSSTLPILQLTRDPVATANKRALSTPDVLTKYPATVVSSACSLVATAATSTSTITVSATVTASPSTFLVSVLTTATDVIVVQPAPTSCASSFRLKLANSGTGYDGQYLVAPVTGTLSPTTGQGDTFKIDSSTGHLVPQTGSSASAGAYADTNAGQPAFAVYFDTPATISASGYQALTCAASGGCGGSLSCSASDGKSIFWLCEPGDGEVYVTLAKPGTSISSYGYCQTASVSLAPVSS